jgi:5' nucleotidase family
MEKIDSTTRKLLYSKNFNKVESFSEKSYVNMDTLFQFVDAQLFALLVDLKDHGDYDFLDFKTYSEIYRDIRQSVDLCHRDGVIKDEVARNPEKVRPKSQLDESSAFVETSSHQNVHIIPQVSGTRRRYDSHAEAVQGRRSEAIFVDKFLLGVHFDSHELPLVSAPSFSGNQSRLQLLLRNLSVLFFLSLAMVRKSMRPPKRRTNGLSCLIWRKFASLCIFGFCILHDTNCIPGVCKTYRIAGSCKPAFMLDPYLQLFRVNMEDGSLKNTDGVFEMNALPNGAIDFLKIGKIFQGGNWQHLHKMMGIKSGDEILYVGDHLYSDVLRSKRTLGWRSLFIMPELEGEIQTFSETLPLREQIEGLRRLRGEIGRKAEEIRRTENAQHPSVQKMLDAMKEDDAVIKATLTPLVDQWHRSFHPIWGAMFNAGYQDSRFAFFVENYACLYTSRASNLGLVSFHKSFRTTMEMLPSDRMVSDSDTYLDESNPWT